MSEGVGEIVCGSRNVFMGYHRDPDKTREAFTEDSWYRTGDQGSVDADGFVTIRGRLKEILVTSGGKNVAPVPIEERIRERLGELAGNVVVIGDGRKYLTCLLTLKNAADPETQEPTGTLARSADRWISRAIWSGTGGAGGTGAREIHTTRDFIMSPHVEALTSAIWKGIEAANAEAGSKVEAVQKFTILPSELTLSGGELSPSMKLKRFYICKKYEEQVRGDQKQRSSPFLHLFTFFLPTHHSRSRPCTPTTAVSTGAPT